MQLQGIWWLPEAPGKKSFGTLLCSEDGGVRLSLIGGFAGGGISAIRRSFDRQFPTILGIAVTEKKDQEVTLRNCFLSKESTSSSALGNKQEFFAHRAYFGAHLTADADFVFESSSVSFSGLAGWADKLTGFSRDAVPLSIVWEQPPQLSGLIPGGTFTLGVGCSSSMSRRKGSMTEEVGITFGFSTPVSDNDLGAKIIYPFQNFFTLATDVPNAMTKLTVSRNTMSFDKITVIGPTTFPDESVADDLVPFEMLFALEDVGDRLERVFNLWLEISQRYYQALVLYFGGIYRPAGYTDLRFSQIMNVLALYHSARELGSLEGSSQIDQLLNDMPRNVSQAHAEQFKKLLRSHPMIGAERALIRLLENHHKEFAPLVTDKDGKGTDAFIKYALNTFNYTLTRDQPRGSYAATGAELHWLSERMAILMKISLLKELEFTNEQVAEILKRNRNFRHIVDNVQPAAPWLQRAS